MEPVNLQVARAIVERTARLWARLASEIGERPMVLPNAAFFPDKFGKDTRSVNRLLSRMQGHAGMSDIPMRARLVGTEPVQPKHGSSCSSGACTMPLDAAEMPPRVIDDGDHWIVHVPEAELSHPVLMTANLARSIGFVFAMETRAEDEPLDAPLEVTVDLTTVLLGFGVLLLEGSYIYAKGCGGPTVARVTKLGPGELSIAFALFAALGGHQLKRALSELGATQQDFVRESKSLVESNPALITGLREAPQRIAAGEFELEESRPWLARVLGGKSGQRRPAPDADASLEELEALVATMPATLERETKKRDPKRDELRALVDEALADSADAE